jgi:hypothetical protein
MPFGQKPLETLQLKSREAEKIELKVELTMIKFDFPLAFMNREDICTIAKSVKICERALCFLEP